MLCWERSCAERSDRWREDRGRRQKEKERQKNRAGLELDPVYFCDHDGHFGGNVVYFLAAAGQRGHGRFVFDLDLHRGHRHRVRHHRRGRDGLSRGAVPRDGIAQSGRSAGRAEAAAEREPRELVLQRRHRRYMRRHLRLSLGGHRGAGRAGHGEHEGDDRDARDERAGRGRDRRREGRGKDVRDGWERAGRAVDCKGALLFPHHFSE